jgi:predicted component of type VI protein secretion system
MPTAQQQPVVVQIFGTDWEVKVVNLTHVTMGLVGDSRAPMPLHVDQLSLQARKQLREKGVMDMHGYVYPAGVAR